MLAILPIKMTIKIKICIIKKPVNQSYVRALVPCRPELNTDCAVKKAFVVQEPQGFSFFIPETHSQLLSQAQKVGQRAREAMAGNQF